MDPTLRRAWRKAGAKMLGGLLLVGGLVGLRLVTVDPIGLEADLAELAAAEVALRAEAGSGAGVDARSVGRSDDPEASGPVAAAGSLMGRMQGVLTGSAPLDPDPDRLVSCRLGGSEQFTRAADCLARGGDSRDLVPRDESAESPAASSLR